MKINTINFQGEKSGNIDISDSVFRIKPNNAVVRQVVLAELTNMRQGTHSSKNRSRVRGGGKKPFKQKGRGAARAGTNRSPLWRGGGSVFGPNPHSYNHKVSKKIKSIS
jgi:large subunit ribosomal protein L4